MDFHYHKWAKNGKIVVERLSIFSSKAKKSMFFWDFFSNEVKLILAFDDEPER